MERCLLLLSALLLSALLLAACAGGPAATPQADLAAKRFDRPAPGKGALYLYRPGWMGLAKAIDVGIASGRTAELGARDYIRIERPPGLVEIDCRVGDRTDARQVEIQDGQTRFVEVSMTFGWWKPGCAVAEVPPDQGQSAVLLATRIEPQ